MRYILVMGFCQKTPHSRLCKENGIKFIGASPEMIDAMGDKSSAKQTMKDAGVPTIPGSDGLLESLEEALEIANKIKYPIMMKATAGGGGKGMRVCKNDDDVRDAWKRPVVKRQQHLETMACTWRSSWKSHDTSKYKLRATNMEKLVTSVNVIVPFNVVTRN